MQIAGENPVRDDIIVAMQQLRATQTPQGVALCMRSVVCGLWCLPHEIGLLFHWGEVCGVVNSQFSILNYSWGV